MQFADLPRYNGRVDASRDHSHVGVYSQRPEQRLGRVDVDHTAHVDDEGVKRLIVAPEN